MTDAERDKRLIVESFKAADILQGLDMAVNDCYVPADRAMQRKVQDKLAEAWNKNSRSPGAALQRPGRALRA